MDTEMTCNEMAFEDFSNGNYGSHEELLQHVFNSETIAQFVCWFETSVSMTYPMSNCRAATVLKSFLVKSHFEKTVGVGILMHLVYATACEVVRRLEQWNSIPHEIGLCCAIDMFLSTWDNHERSLKPYDKMASVIQTHFWFAHARWLTNTRLLKFFASRKFTMENYRVMNVGDREGVMQAVNFERYFNFWLRRMASMVVKRTKNTKLEYDPAVMSLHAVKMCMFAYNNAPDAGEGVLSEILRVARVLDPLVDKCLSGDYSEAEQMLTAMVEFGTVFGVWWRENSNRIRTSIQQHLYSFSYLHAIGGASMHSAMVEDLKRRYGYLTSREEVAVYMQESPVMMVLHDAVRSPVWKSWYTNAQILHELLMDNAFAFNAIECFPILTNRYMSDLPTSVDSATFQPMLRDIMAATMYSCKLEPDAQNCIDVFKVDSVPGGSEFCAYARQVFNFMITRLNNDARVSDVMMEWSCIDDRNNVLAVMRFLFLLAKEIRVSVANVVVNAARMMGLQSRLDFEGSALNSFDKTRIWIRRELVALGSYELELVRSGDPFMLLRFHDRALVNLVCDGFVGAACVPEVLELDVHRLEEIHSIICMLCDTPVMQYVFCELVTSNCAPRSVKYVPPHSMILAAVKLRAVMVVCRTVHADATMRLTRDLAGDVWDER